MVYYKDKGLARTFADEVYLKILQFIFKKIHTHCHRWAKWYWKIYVIKNVGWNRRTFSWRCVKKKDLSIGYLDQYAAIQSSRTVWKKWCALFEDVETLKENKRKRLNNLATQTF